MIQGKRREEQRRNNRRVESTMRNVVVRRYAFSPNSVGKPFGQTLLTGFPDSTIYQWANMQK